MSEHGLSDAQKVSQLEAMGFSREDSLRAVGIGAPVSEEAKPSRAPIEFPIRIRLPWTALCSDNFRERASLAMIGGKPFPRKVMDARFRAAREKVVAISRSVMAGAAAIADEPLHLVARVWLPDNRQTNDVCNFAKGVHDAMQGIVYKNDGQLHDTRWVRAGVDPDAPRADIEIRLL